MSTGRDARIARMRASALAGNVHEAHDTDADDLEYVHDDEPATRGDAQPDFSSARERMLETFRDMAATPVETGE